MKTFMKALMLGVGLMLGVACFSAKEATEARWRVVDLADADYLNSQAETRALITEHVRVKTEIALAEKTNLYNAALSAAKGLPVGDERDDVIAGIGADWADGKAAVVKDAGDDFLNYCLILAKNEAQNQALHATNEMADEQLTAMELDLSDFVTEETVRAVVSTVFEVVKRQTPEALRDGNGEEGTGTPGEVPSDVTPTTDGEDEDVKALSQRLMGQAAQIEKAHGHSLPPGHHNTKPSHGHSVPAGHHNTKPHH